MPVSSSHVAFRGNGQLIEALESRQLLASTAPYFGTYAGAETYTFDGVDQSVPTSVTIAPIVKKSSITTQQTAQEAEELWEMQITRSLLSIILVAVPIYLETSPAPPVGQSHRTADAAASLATTSDYVATLPASFGSGRLEVVNGTALSILATVHTGIFADLPFNFNGTKITPKKAAATVAAKKTPSATTLGLQSLKLNPALGTFKGHMTRASDSTEFKTSAVIKNNKKGHPAIHLQIAEPGVGTIEITSVIHPTHTGTFTLDLGDEPLDGFLMGHITHTGRMVLHLTVPTISDLVGSQKRHD